MTAEKLKHYRALLAEADRLSRDLRAAKDMSPAETSDSVASAAEFPYSLHIVRIDGLDWEAYNRNIQRIQRLRQQALDRATQELAEIEEWIATVDDPHIRDIIRYRYIDGFSWQQVARKVGGGNTGDSVRKAHARYLNEK